MTRSAKGRLTRQIGRPLKSLLAAAVLGLGTGFTAVQVQADTLWEVYLQALDNDPQLAADRAAYRAGLEAKNIGRSALLPQVNASADYTKTRTNSESIAQTCPDGTRLCDQIELINGFSTGNSDVDSHGYAARLDQALFS